MQLERADYRPFFYRSNCGSLGVAMTNKNTDISCRSHRSAYLVRLLLPTAWLIAVGWLSLTPSPPQVHGIMGWDKLLHAGAYGLLTILLAQSFLIYLQNPWHAGWLAVLCAVACGGLLEILQMTMQSGRTAEWMDLVADAVGAILGCVIFRQIVVLYWRHYECPGSSHG